MRRVPVTAGLLSACLFSLAPLADAAPNPFGPRAGSSISGTSNQYGTISRRPYRRRQPQQAPQQQLAANNFDYRLEGEENSEDFALNSFGSSTDNFVQPAGFCACDGPCCCGSCVIGPGCGCDDCCEPACGCDDVCCNDVCCGGACLPCCDVCCPSWTFGYEFSFVRPRYSQNVAFTTLESDGNNNDVFTDTEFDYDLDLNPRVWIDRAMGNNWSWRVTWWQFDHEPGTLTTSPNANGFGEITHPDFGDVDISTTIPTDTFTASSTLQAYTFDLEALKQTRFSGWQLEVGGGVRYASVAQSYFAQLQDNGANVLGQIDFNHELEGFGPTMGLLARRPLFGRVKLVCAARGSVLFGDGLSRLDAMEDTTPSTTVRITNREDLLPIGEARAGLEWTGLRRPSGWQWLLSTAMEGQIWGNAGNAASETADLGFFGFNVGMGLIR